MFQKVSKTIRTSMPNQPEDHLDWPDSNGHDHIDGFDLPSSGNAFESDENESEYLPQGQEIGRLSLRENNVWSDIDDFDQLDIAHTSSDVEEKSEISDENEPQDEDRDNGDNAPFFGDNPVYLRRYKFVSELLKDQKWTLDIKRLVDIGANNCEFLYRLRNNGGMRHLREAIALDIDESELEWNSRKTEPLNIGHLLKEHVRRFYPLDVYHIAGSVGDIDKRLENVDAVTAIELIEHLHPDTLKAFPEVVFAHMRPKLAVITTPNRDFNVLFPNFEGPFRHWDHKFEFTRNEFKEWALEIVGKYTEYQVTFDGVGEQPLHIESEEDLGFCSQIATFIRKDFDVDSKNGLFANKERGSWLNPNINLVENHSGRINAGDMYPYKVVVHHRAEHTPDQRSMELRCFHTLNSHIKELSSIDFEYLNENNEDDKEFINPKIYFHRIQNHLKEYCYDNYGDEYTELDEEKVGKIFMEYKEDFIVGQDENGIYFQVKEDYWLCDLEFSDDESTSDIGDTAPHEVENTITTINDSSLDSWGMIVPHAEDTSSDWSNSEDIERPMPIVPPSTLNQEESWSDKE